MAAKLKLYWCTTEDHDEDWFIVARTARSARRLHEDMEGYARGDATAKLVASLPPDLTVDEGWPSNKTIQACGGVFLPMPPQSASQYLMGEGNRAVKFGNDVYTEGSITANVRARLRSERGTSEMN